MYPTSRFGRRAAFGALVLMAGACGAEASSSEAGSIDSATVARVIDGDSVELIIDGETVESRLIGINAPELADCQGETAKTALAGIAGGQRVTVEDFGTDRFGRLLVNLSINDMSVNLAMIRTGWALGQHTSEHDDAKEWVAAMTDAATDGLGMWDLPAECPPAEAQVAITDVEPDPPGPDDDVLDEEWIEITNGGDRAVDLTGWALRDESTSNRFVFGPTELAAGATLRLRTGCGADTATDVYWCSPNGVWSNRGDTAVLLGPSGSIEDWRVFS